MATVITNVGEDWAAQRLAGTGALSANAGTHVGFGTGTTTAAKAQTALVTEVETRGATTISVVGAGASAVYQAVATIAATAARIITEVGLFSAATVGSMFLRSDFAAINLNSGDSIEFTITIDPA